MSEHRSISLVKICQKHFKPRNIQERNAFLAILSLMFVNHAQHGRLSTLLDCLVDNQTSPFSLDSYELTELERLIAKSISDFGDPNRIKAVFKELKEYLTKEPLSTTETSSLITLYEQTLKRLQLMNVEDRTAEELDYQMLPDDFSRFIKAIYDNNQACVYEAISKTGELSLYLAAQKPDWHYTTESYTQSPVYFMHKFAIAGCSDCVVSQSNALASDPFIKHESYDLAFTLHEPVSLRKTRHTKQEADKLTGFYDSERIDTESFPSSKYTDHALIQHLLWSINSTGLVIAFIGRGALQREEEKQARKKLVDKNVVDAIIQLPTSLINGRTVDLFAVLLRKNKSSQDTIFINASQFYARATRRNRLINEMEIADILLKRQSIEGLSDVVSNEAIQENKYSLNVTTYVTPEASAYSNDHIEALQREIIENQTRSNSLYEKLMA